MKKTLCLLNIVFCLTSCAGKQADDAVLSKEALYDRAKTHLFHNDFVLAANDFEKIEEMYPFTREASKGVLMASYSHYKSKNYDESLRLIEYCKKINFNNANLEYLHFLEILNNLGKIEISSKNIDLVNSTLKLIDSFIARFSENNIYAEYLLQQRRELANLHVKRELEIVDFYISDNNFLGAINHLKNIEYYSDKYYDEINFRFYELYRHINYKNGMQKYLHC
jgi:outer membrane protein assembly factor BamD